MSIVLKTIQRISIVYLFFVAGDLSATATNPSEQIDVTEYGFTITLNDTTNVISGSAEIVFVTKKNTRDFELDLINSGSDNKGMRVREVTRNGSSLKFTHENDRLKIYLDKEVIAGSTGSVIISYAGVPRDGLIISENKFGDRTFFADNWPNRGRNWIPVVDHPADKARVQFAVIAPLHYEVVANGVRQEESYLDNRQKITRYRQGVPISTKVMVIGVARFAVQRSGVVDHVPVEAWVYPQNREAGFHDYALAVDILEYFNKKIGPYPYGKLANVQSKTTFGGLENASAIFYYENSVTGKAAIQGLVAHEIAHQWFGNSATEKDWQHVWLSEGFATYFSLLYDEFKDGIAARQEKMKEDRRQVIEYNGKTSSPVVVAQVSDPMSMLNANSYQKGGWVLHMLRNEVGDSAFWRGIRNYYATYRDSIAETEHFRQVMEKASGKNLSPFFNQWLYTAGHPSLKGNWKYNSREKTIELTIWQVQKGQLFDFPLEIAIIGKDGKGSDIHSLNINKESQTFSLPVAFAPGSVAPDPNVNLLFEGELSN